MKVDDLTGCWLWTGGTTHNGYGKMRRGGDTVRVHRLAWELMVGPIEAGLELDHLCSERLCVNPAHLEPVSKAENLRRSKAHNKPTSKVNESVLDSETYLEAYAMLLSREEEE